MTHSEKIARLEQIFRDVLDRPNLQLTPDFSPADCSEWDSVATVQIILAVEAAFRIRVPTEAVSRLQTVREMLALLP